MDDVAVRASDAERDAAAERLRVAYGEGRLSGEEFSDRLELVLAARTRGELTGPVADLPAAPARPLAPLDASRTGGLDAAGERVPARRCHDDPARAWGAWAVASTVCVAVWLVSVVSGGGLDGVWPVWVVLPWGLVLLAGTLGRGPVGRGRPGRVSRRALNRDPSRR